MFTGIIKEVGKIKKLKDVPNGREIEISCNIILDDIKKGDSINVNGCCLTVKEFYKNSFCSDISFTTLSATSFNKVKIKDPVNLETALKLNEKLGGHFVTGHIDGVSNILGIEKFSNFYRFRFETPQKLVKYIAKKGSISVEGISLTVEESDRSSFFATIIPHTYINTNLKSKKIGDEVNIEIDLIARYIEQVIKNTGSDKTINKNTSNDKIIKEKLIKYGFYK